MSISTPVRHRDPNLIANGAWFAGSVKWFSEEKGYGFIAPDAPIPGLDNDRDMFVHIKSVQRPKDMQQGTVVKFQVERNPKNQRLSACNLQFG